MRKTLLIVAAVAALFYAQSNRPAGGRDAARANAPTLLDYLDESAAIYGVLPNVKKAIDTLRTSGPLRLLDDEEFGAFIAQGLTLIESMQDEAQRKAAKLQQPFFKHVLHGEHAIALSFSEKVPFAIHYRCPLADEAAETAVKELLDTYFEELGKSPRNSAKRMEDGDGWAVSVEGPPGSPLAGTEFTMWTFVKSGAMWSTLDPAVRERIRAGETADAPLRQAKSYRAALDAAAAANADAFVYLNDKPLTAGVERLLERDPTAPEHVADAMKLSGLLGGGYWAMASEFTDGMMRERLVRQLGEDSESIMGVMMDNAEPGLTLMAEAPANAVYYLAAKVDPDGLFDDSFEIAEKIADMTGNPMPEEASLDSPEVQQLREFFVGSFGGEFSIAVVLRDNAVVPEVLVTAVLSQDNTLGDVADAIMAEIENEGAEIRRVEYSGTTLFVIQLEDAPVTPTVAFTDDRLYFGLTPNTVKRAIKRKGSSLADQPKVEAVMERLRTDMDKAVAVQWLDLERLARYGAGFAEMLGGAMEQVPGGFDASDLPDVDTFAPHLGQSLAVATVSNRLLSIEMAGKMTPLGSACMFGLGLAAIYQKR